MTMIPDTIEPYIGWKALRIGSDGTLQSPQMATPWPVGHRLEAICSRQGPWLLTPSTVNTTVAVLTPAAGWPPQTLDPTHVPAQRHCSCGIYAVDHAAAAHSYMNMDSVLCKVALWGNVVIANQGARGQYAYPQQMWVPAHLHDVGPLVADLYGIPYTFEPHGWSRAANPTFPTAPPPPPRPTRQQTAAQQRQQAREDARAAAQGFLILAAFMLIIAACAAVISGRFVCVFGPAALTSMFGFLSLVARLDSKT